MPVFTTKTPFYKKVINNLHFALNSFACRRLRPFSAPFSLFLLPLLIQAFWWGGQGKKQPRKSPKKEQKNKRKTSPKTQNKNDKKERPKTDKKAQKRTKNSQKSTLKINKIPRKCGGKKRGAKKKNNRQRRPYKTLKNRTKTEPPMNAEHKHKQLKIK
ncbi:MAG: hypothetical protein LBN95_02390 [Prevotellaceae bacterium]|nr:hypothetical protein [Prevotellaceae bacterium]